jgi:hypothetical protein
MQARIFKAGWASQLRVLSFLSIAALTAFLCAPAFAEPGAPVQANVMVHPIRGIARNAQSPSGRRFEPPDPCRQYHARRAHLRCVARLHRSGQAGAHSNAPGSK